MSETRASEWPTVQPNANELVVPFVAELLDMTPDEFDPCVAAGIVLSDQLIAGVIYHQYRPSPHGGTIEASIASTSPKWATRAVLRELFGYPFQQLKVSRLQTHCARKNHHARAFNRRLGFKMEGVCRRLWDGKQDAFLWSMLPEECKWI